MSILGKISDSLDDKIIGFPSVDSDLFSTFDSSDCSSTRVFALPSFNTFAKSSVSSFVCSLTGLIFSKKLSNSCSLSLLATVLLASSSSCSSFLSSNSLA